MTPPNPLSGNGELVAEPLAELNEPPELFTAEKRLIVEMRDVAAWFERTKPQGLLYDSARPTLKAAADALEGLMRYAALGMACERNGLGWYNADGEMRFQAPDDVIADNATAPWAARAEAAESLNRQMAEALEAIRFTTSVRWATASQCTARREAINRIADRALSAREEGK